MSQAECQAACRRVFEKNVDKSQRVTPQVLLKCLQEAQAQNGVYRVYSFLYYMRWNHAGLVKILREAIPLLEIAEAHEHQRQAERETMLAALSE